MAPFLPALSRKIPQEGHTVQIDCVSLAYICPKHLNMSTLVTCPNCKSQFALEEVMTDEIKKELRAEMLAFKSQKEAEFRQKMDDLEKQRQEMEQKLSLQLDQEKHRMNLEVRKRVGEEYEAKIKDLEEEREKKAQQLLELQKKELELMRQKSDLELERKNFEMEMEKRVMQKQHELEEQITKREQSSNELKLKEREMQIEQLKKLIEEMKRKSEQGSMQLQGEVQELALEELLRGSFPADRIEEVGKGVKGADVIQTVVNKMGQECGSIIYESKRTQAFAGDWVEKLKADMRSQGADIAVIVTQAMPKDMNGFGFKDGVWICGFQEAKSVAMVLRSSLIRIQEVLKSQENKGDKMTMLYDYLTGNEFRQHIEAIAEGFLSMKSSIIRERAQMEKMWKEREKQLDKVLLNTTHMFASIKGIAGSAIGDIKLLDGESSLELE